MLVYRLMNRASGKGQALRIFCCFIALNFIAVTCVMSAQEESGGDEKRDAAYSKMELLTEAILHIKKNYVEEKTYEQIINGALHGMLQALDSHSDFLEPEAFNDIQEETRGKYGGIGIHVGMRDGMITVISPIEDTPAYKVGMQAGDRIVEIDGEKTIGMKLDAAVKKMRGQKGTKILLTIRRSDEDDLRQLTIVRDDIEVPSVKGSTIMGDGVGYVRITQFALPTSGSLEESLKKLKQQGMNALILDLRNNPGGLLISAIDVSKKFLPKGKLIVTTKGREGVVPKDEKFAQEDGAYLDFPMVLLVNAGSASASEIVAGALQDNKRAVIVGSTSFGKGSVQSVLPLKAGDTKGALRLTTARYYTPAGRMIHDKGIDPDIPVYLSAKEWRDVQLKRLRAENPESFSKQEKEEYKDAVDRPLQRAFDLLQAMKVVHAQNK